MNEETGVKKGRIQKGTSDFCDVDMMLTNHHIHTYCTILKHLDSFPLFFRSFFCLDGGVALYGNLCV